MNSLPLREFHLRLNARFGEINDQEIVADYGDFVAEHQALRGGAGVLDLSFRGRLCLTGTDRHRFLHGQVTNDVNALGVGDGCYAALITAKGKMISDLNVYRLANELLLDFEPGLSRQVAERLERYIIADDVQVVDAAPHYNLFSVQGPAAQALLSHLGWDLSFPSKPMSSVCYSTEQHGDIYLMNQPRLSTAGFDLYVPAPASADITQKLNAASKAVGGRFCGWDAFETARIEAGVPRFGADMDESNLPPEAGLETRAISYSKGCYIGQEVIARIRTYGQVAKTLRGLRLADNLLALPKKGDRLLKDGKEVGFVTSAVASPALNTNIALGYVRREANAVGTDLVLHTEAGESSARIVPLPFEQNFA